MLTVRVSQLNHCRFCVDLNSATLLRRGVSEQFLSTRRLAREQPLRCARAAGARLRRGDDPLGSRGHRPADGAGQGALRRRGGDRADRPDRVRRPSRASSTPRSGCRPMASVGYSLHNRSTGLRRREGRCRDTPQWATRLRDARGRQTPVGPAWRVYRLPIENGDGQTFGSSAGGHFDPRDRLGGQPTHDRDPAAARRHQRRSGPRRPWRWRRCRPMGRWRPWRAPGHGNAARSPMSPSPMPAGSDAAGSDAEQGPMLQRGPSQRSQDSQSGMTQRTQSQIMIGEQPPGRPSEG